MLGQRLRLSVNQGQYIRGLLAGFTRVDRWQLFSRLDIATDYLSKNYHGFPVVVPATLPGIESCS